MVLVVGWGLKFQDVLRTGGVVGGGVGGRFGAKLSRCNRKWWRWCCW